MSAWIAPEELTEGDVIVLAYGAQEPITVTSSAPHARRGYTKVDGWRYDPATAQMRRVECLWLTGRRSIVLVSNSLTGGLARSAHTR